MMRRLLAAGAIAVAIVVSGGGPTGILPIGIPPASAASDPVAFVTNLGTQAIQVLGPSVSAAQRLARFRELFRNDFDVPGIGQFVLGRYWRTATPAEQQEFLGLFQEYIVEAYSARLGEYGGQPFRVTGSRTNGGDTVVTSRIIQKNGAPMEVDWDLADQGGTFKITDVYVGGVSMKVTERDEFGAVIQRNGGQVSALLAQLRQKVQR
jgi:phospholipid transport system substrate-binding protein